ncbi:hypothetical protein [Paraburkholderia rhizosphaerae]|uniref:Uncharacterized protein n=1 Tax=Paraburkholderia rhizosphaerae TaxID=480658 RepID=A0A4V3HEL1_9BURK|nr:hypothetical protein [Paraburkholderia rhizosphaerae]TDY48249.1 hypothetical protein BX592_111184 [Paraburkholderia rhizosphaerae]
MLNQLDQIAHAFCIVLTGQTPGTPEAVYCYDLKDGAPLGHATGTFDGVGLPPEAVAAGRDRLRDVKVTHTHPNDRLNVSLSDADLRVLWLYPGVTEVDAVALDGSWFRARRVERDGDHAQAARFAYHAIRRAVLAEVQLVLCPEATTPAEIKTLHDEVRTHLMCAALDRLGVIRYTFSLAAGRAKRWKPHEARLDGWISAVVREYRRSNW